MIMNSHFDLEIDRSDTGAIKWEIIQDHNDPEHWVKTDAYFGKNRILPMWVADMDLSCPEVVQKALEERAQHPIYGYTMADESYYQAVSGWMNRRFGWHIKNDWIITTPGVIPALHVLVRTFASPGKKVLVQRPVYYPFFSTIKENNCQIVSNSLILDNGKYTMDFDDLEQKTADPEVVMAILSSPHNPVGRVWSRDEIRKFAKICLKNSVLVISDEIHGDLIYPGNQFTPMGLLEDELVKNSVICTAPSKTFNLAGLQTSNIIIPDIKTRIRFQQALKKIGYLGPNPFGMVACRAAYNEGEPWLETLLLHLDSNLKLLKKSFSEKIPHIPVIDTQGTYLIWFDCRALKLDHLKLRALMLEKARVFLDEGYIFGPEGKGFERINIACPQPVLLEAIDRITKAILTI
jgi:cysteine-S-conjugate beta-lyase